jgi:purine-nucleoside phosphorylase
LAKTKLVTSGSPRAPRDALKVVDFLKSEIVHRPSIALVLGSGLGDFGDTLADSIAIPADELTGYPKPTIEGHKGRLVFGRIGTNSVLAFQGRIHYYESGNLNNVLFPIFVAAGLGVSTLLVTNAAGGINRQYEPGDLMLITDHINMTFRRLPTINIFGACRPGNTQKYDHDLQELIATTAAHSKILLRRGVYCGVLGPSYETATEIEMLRRMGADAVGMSTVNEVDLASSLGLRIAGISCITNLATGITDSPLSHTEVTDVAAQVRNRFRQLLSRVINSL